MSAFLTRPDDTPESANGKGGDVFFMLYKLNTRLNCSDAGYWVNVSFLSTMHTTITRTRGFRVPIELRAMRDGDDRAAPLLAHHGD